METRLGIIPTTKCDLCENVALSSLDEAKKHYMDIHGIIGYLVCCNEKFMRAAALEIHMLLHVDPSYFK